MTNQQNDFDTNFSEDTKALENSQTLKDEDKKPAKKPIKKSKKIIIIILCILLGFLILLSSVAAAFWFSGKNKLLDKDVEIKPADEIETEIYDDNTISYNGSVYRYNDAVTTVLCLGVDKRKVTGAPSGPIGNSGQADAIFLVVIDTNSGKTSVIALPRDAMADIELFSSNGTFAGTEKTQLCLAYAYGDGKKTSCENTARAVSRLLCGMPVNSYFAIDYRSIKTLHNAVGTVRVVPNETFSSFKKGVPVNLRGSQAFAYLQARNKNTLNAAYLRLERQLDYLKQYSVSAINRTKNDITFPLKLYNRVVSNSITNIDASKVTYLATTVVSNKETASVDFIKLNGEYKKGEDNFSELYLDNTQIFETVLSLFYTKIK